MRLLWLTSLVLVILALNTHFARAQDYEGGFDEPPEVDEGYDPDDDYEPPPPPNAEDGVRTPPIPRGFKAPPPPPRERGGFVGGRGSPMGSADGEIEFQLTDPPKYYKKKVRPPLKKPKSLPDSKK